MGEQPDDKPIVNAICLCQCHIAQIDVLSTCPNFQSNLRLAVRFLSPKLHGLGINLMELVW
jgi:hypothetical protein